MKTLGWVIVLALAASFVTVAAADIVPALPFEKNSGNTTTDLSPYGNDGTLNGASWTNGKIGKALTFDASGPNWVDAGDDASLHLDSDLTLAAWVSLANTNESARLLCEG